MYQGSVATVRFVGMTLWCSDPLEWCGIEFDQSGHGKHDGFVNGVRYFDAKPKSALFVRARALMQPAFPQRTNATHATFGPPVYRDDASADRLDWIRPGGVATATVTGPPTVGTKAFGMDQRWPRRTSMPTGSAVREEIRRRRSSLPTASSATCAECKLPDTDTSGADSDDCLHHLYPGPKQSISGGKPSPDLHIDGGVRRLSFVSMRSGSTRTSSPTTPSPSRSGSSPSQSKSTRGAQCARGRGGKPGPPDPIPFTTRQIGPEALGSMSSPARSDTAGSHTVGSAGSPASPSKCGGR